MNTKILIAEDEENIRLLLERLLQKNGYSTYSVDNGVAALEIARAREVDVILTDIRMPGMDGIDLIKEVKQLDPCIEVLVMTAYASVETAIEAVRLGARDYIRKPFDIDEVLEAVRRAAILVRKKEEQEIQALRAEDLMVANSQCMKELKRLIAKVADTSATVNICGETGVGKELVARAIHGSGARRDKPFIQVNCSAFPETLLESELFGHEKGAFTGADKARKGKFELADKGTLFLDEIADMSLKTQAKILRILQEQKFERVGGTKSFRVDVRVIAATNKDLVREMTEGRFRQDLYYRLNVFPVTVPALRERAEDIPEMIGHFSRLMIEEQSLQPVRLDSEVMDALKRYAWPGNVRELRNFVERIYILYQGRDVDISMLPPEYRAVAALDALAAVPDGVTDFKEARARFEEAFLRRGLARSDGNIARLAEAIGLERTYLYRKLKTYGIGIDEGRQRDGLGRQ